jgi:predicted RNA-binding Zn-ribbon protein involved in translation (DUF1610 family)
MDMKCPKCGRELRDLEATILVYENYKVTLEPDGTLNYEFTGSSPEGTKIFYCPHCYHFLTDKEEEAKKLLSVK